MFKKEEGDSDSVKEKNTGPWKFNQKYVPDQDSKRTQKKCNHFKSLMKNSDTNRMDSEDIGIKKTKKEITVEKSNARDIPNEDMPRKAVPSGKKMLRKNNKGKWEN